MPKSFNHALVIGKFYPFHNGHKLLIEGALEKADNVTVMVYGSQFQEFSGAQRVEWIQEEFAGKPVEVLEVINDVYDDYVDLNIWEAHDHIMKARLRVAYGPDMGKIDLIVSSEDYGKTIATYFKGCSFHVVDQAREAVPISGTEIRENIVDNWKMLPKSVRKATIPRVIVVGAESTGTTTLSLALAEHYQARYVPEYGREYTIDWLDALKESEPDATMESLVWREADFERIGTRQLMLENRAATKLDGYPLVIGDTDSLATGLWEARYLSPDLSASAPWRPFLNNSYAKNLPGRDLYIITDHVGVPFEDDGYRDGEHIREDMTRWFEDALTVRQESWVLVRGTHEERMAIAVKMIDRIMTVFGTFD